MYKRKTESKRLRSMKLIDNIKKEVDE